MAAFINALYEEGTLEDIRKWIKKLALEKGMFYNISEDMSRTQLIKELSRIWHER